MTQAAGPNQENTEKATAYRPSPSLEDLLREINEQAIVQPKYERDQLQAIFSFRRSA